MKVYPNGGELIVTLEDGERLRLTTPAAGERICVYLEVKDGKLEFVGGASIISKISGHGMAAKVTD